MDVGALLSSTERAERQRVKLEAALVEARATARTFRITAAHAQSASRHSQSQLTELTSKLATSKERIASLSVRNICLLKDDDAAERRCGETWR